MPQMAAHETKQFGMVLFDQSTDHVAFILRPCPVCHERLGKTEHLSGVESCPAFFALPKRLSAEARLEAGQLTQEGFDRAIQSRTRAQGLFLASQGCRRSLA